MTDPRPLSTRNFGLPSGLWTEVGRAIRVLELEYYDWGLPQAIKLLPKVEKRAKHGSEAWIARRDELAAAISVAALRMERK